MGGRGAQAWSCPPCMSLDKKMLFYFRKVTLREQGEAVLFYALH